ncbi:uncharacterized protein TRUGW13939_06589 [Talaromyces rugulosus]|uniref:Uncharacterized protein n=1 Tax=Talaromyces rugulosus TaxID=121627 RepID=A0A7H8R121_TALRU|nr:uncharacterized protein TRUGW13939_06589 [Talaromyces rugulosus]QKX59455.1 hypothetical protein TRUGW13939_06589 [Talaromyces rugulosus]
MAGVSRFSENFEHTRLDSTSSNMADAHYPAQKPQKLCPSPLCNAGKTMRSLMMKPYHGLCAITHSYKQHLNIMLNTNLNTSSKSPELLKGHDNVEAGSTAYGLRPASEEELRHQRERIHIDYVFGLGPDAYNITDTTTINNTTTTTTKKAAMPDLKYRTFDVRACWIQAYTSDTSSEIENINNTYNDYLYSISENSMITTIPEEDY